jgi:hypothetical protein
MLAETSIENVAHSSPAHLLGKPFENETLIERVLELAGSTARRAAVADQR